MNADDAHLLIVDDDERIRTLLQKFLMRNGFLVTAARDAAHARRILSGLDFDMIVMDVMMPDEDGVSLTQALRAAGHATAICTNKPEALAVDLVAKLGVSDLFDALVRVIYSLIYI